TGRIHRRPRHRLHAHVPDLRDVWHRRDHRGAARPRQAARSRAGRAAVRRAARGWPPDAGRHLHAAVDRDSHPGAGGALRGSPAADPGHLSAAQGHRRRPATGERVERMTALAAPLSAQASLTRRVIAPATLILLGLVSVLGFGMHAKHGDASFAFSQTFAKVTVPNLDLPARTTCYVLGGLSVAIGIARGLVPMD